MASNSFSWDSDEWDDKDDEENVYEVISDKEVGKNDVSSDVIGIPRYQSPSDVIYDCPPGAVALRKSAVNKINVVGRSMSLRISRENVAPVIS